ncbi:MAG TPA: ABC transporter substrate binding protein [Methylomirabilota bacterium]|nr:ABC transporter substrate binding protein [Methylomirabilota bacterium]
MSLILQELGGKRLELLREILPRLSRVAVLHALAELAMKHRLPTVFSFREYVEAGGLLSYGPDLGVQQRRAARYVDLILRGARPGDLPVEQPTHLELAVNLKTAKTLGLTVPPSILLRADRVIE